jgi:hypothetical protein
MLRETIAVYCEIKSNHINKFWGENVGQSDVKAGGKHSYHCTVLSQSEVSYVSDCRNVSVRDSNACERYKPIASIFCTCVHVVNKYKSMVSRTADSEYF